MLKRGEGLPHRQSRMASPGEVEKVLDSDYPREGEAENPVVRGRTKWSSSREDNPLQLSVRRST